MCRILLFSSVLFILFLNAGCGRSKDENREFQKTGVNEGKKIDPGLAARLTKFGVSAANIANSVYSPDSEYLALEVDSSVSFGPGDKMWSAELPSDWFGTRSRKMLFAYIPRKDSLFKVTECEEIVNFYRKTDSLPVMTERWERYGAIIWSADSRKLLLLKDRETEGLESQDALIFTLGVQDPAFLDLASIWREIMIANPGSPGTKVERITWHPQARITIILSVKGSTPPLKKELIFDAASTRLITSKDI